MIYKMSGDGLFMPKMEWTGARAGFDRYKLLERHAVPTVKISMEMCQTKQENVALLTILGDMLGVPVSYNFKETDDEQDTISLEVCSPVTIRKFLS